MKKVAPNPYFFSRGRAIVWWLAFASSNVSTTSLSGIRSRTAAALPSESITPIPDAQNADLRLMTLSWPLPDDTRAQLHVPRIVSRRDDSGIDVGNVRGWRPEVGPVEEIEH